MKKTMAILLALALTAGLCACGKEVQENEIPAEEENPVEITESPDSYENANVIFLNNGETTVNGAPATESDCVSLGGEIIYYRDRDEYESGNPYGEGEEKDKHTEKEAAEHTLVTITKAGEYLVFGELYGQIAVDLGEDAKSDPEAKVTLILDGADIRCEIAPAVIFYNVYECSDGENSDHNVDTSAAGANVIIADNSVNNIEGAYVARIYEDAPGEEKLHKYDGTFYSKRTMNVSGGTLGNGVLNITAENEGLNSEMHLTVNGGNINIEAQDDGINTNEDYISVLTVNGGNLSVKGGLGIEGDGIDSNGWIVINGGSLFASGNGRTGDGGIDADMGITVNGGEVAAFGSRNDSIGADSAQAFVQLNFGSSKKAGTEISFTDAEGKGITAVSDREFFGVILSGAELRYNNEYTLLADGTVQEYTSVTGASSGMGGMMPGGAIPEDDRGRNGAFEIPEGFEEWLESAEDIPEDIREWLEGLGEIAEEFSSFGGKGEGTEKGNMPGGAMPEGGMQGQLPGGEMPGGMQNQGGNGYVDLSEGSTDNTVFLLSAESCCFSGIIASAESTGKTNLEFTVNGESRFGDIFLGDGAGIESIGAKEKIKPAFVQLSLHYIGTSEEITVARTCLLSEGYDKVNALFEDLEAGDYCFTVSVSDECADYTGSTEFRFSVVE